MSARLIERVDAILADAARWSADALLDGQDATLVRDRQRLAFDIFELHQLSAHLPFDTARLLPRVSVVRALQDQVSMILPLGAAGLDRVEQLRAYGPIPDAVATLLADVRAWLSTGAPAGRQAEALGERAVVLEQGLAMATWPAMLVTNLLVRVADLVDAHATCSALRDRLALPHSASAGEHVDSVLRRTGRRPLHRDHGSALRSALSASAAVLLLCAIWIGTAWPDGGTAALISGAVAAILASSGANAAAAGKLLVGAVAGLLICAAYDFALLPRVTDFVPLVAVLAPAFLLVGGMMTVPATAPYALGLVVTVPTSIGLADRYAASFDSFINGNMALLSGMALPVLMLVLFSTGSGGRARRPAAPPGAARARATLPRPHRAADRTVAGDDARPRGLSLPAGRPRRGAGRRAGSAPARCPDRHQCRRSASAERGGDDGRRARVHRGCPARRPRSPAPPAAGRGGG